MKVSQYRDEEELLRQAIDLLMDRFGPVETARFLSLAPSRRMESVKRHRTWQKTLDQDEFFNAAFGKKPAGRPQ